MSVPPGTVPRLHAACAGTAPQKTSSAAQCDKTPAALRARLAGKQRLRENACVRVRAFVLVRLRPCE